MNLTNIQHHNPELIMDPGYFKSAVNIPLIKSNDGYHVLFEVRSSKLEAQPGDICFPGGHIEIEESPLDAALRETSEELLISHSQIDVIGPGDILHDRNRIIYSFISEIQNYSYSYSIDEVDHVFTVPLNELLLMTPESYLVDRISMPQSNFPFDRIHGGRNYQWRISHIPEYFFEYNNYHIWGVTAVILKSFLDIIR